MSAPELNGYIEIKFDASKITKEEVEKKVKKAIRGNTWLEDKYDAERVKFSYDANNKMCIDIDQWNTWQFDDFVTELIEDLDKTGKKIWLDGQVDAYGDEDPWFYDVTHNKVTEHQKTEQDLFYAKDEDLIAILRKRGYVVTKKEKKGKK